MAVRDWLKKIIGSGSGTVETALSSQPPIAQPSRARAGKNDVIAYAVNLSGLVIDQPEAIAFYHATFADCFNPQFSIRDFRKQGDLLDKDALKALGLRSNVKLSAQFLGTLTDSGRSDPLGAACVIGCTISTALSAWRDLGNMVAAGIEFAEFHASNSAVGPCDAAASLDSQRVPIGDAEQLPFKSCPHPGECCCMFQARLSLRGEF